jgi:hypothetical protein
MDVEENELNVLYGASETLKNSNYPTILFECNGVNGTENNPENNQNTIPNKLFNYLKNIKYKIIPINGCKNMFLASH